jgi:ABC-2 type transport system ATP-binding protein
MELKIEGLSKRYPGGVQALAGVSLTIRPGMFGLLGPNGAGKSTLMRILATLQDADAGTVTLDGIDVLRQKEQVRKLLGYLPQEFGLYPKVPAADLLDHLAALKGIAPAARRKELVEALLRRTNLYQVRYRPLGSFLGRDEAAVRDRPGPAR